jgi:hypothetical protein
VRPASPFFGLDASIRLAGRDLPPALADPHTVGRIASRLSGIPAALSDWLYFEVRLDAQRTAEVDVSARIQRTQRQDLLDATAFRTANSPLPGLAVWWNTPRGNALISQLWLEFDAPEYQSTAGSTAPIPGIFIECSAAERLHPSAQVRTRAVLDMVPSLRGAAMSAALVRQLDQAVRALPAHADVMYVGHFAGRSSPAIRLSVMRLNAHEVLPYLERIGWRYDSEAFAAMLSVAMRHKDGPRPLSVLNIDITAEGIAPRLGLEFALSRPPQWRGALPDAAFLDDLVTLGAIAPVCRAALAQWPGAARTALSHELWPSIAARCVNHIKLVHVPGTPVSAKAYLSWTHIANVHARRPALDAERIDADIYSMDRNIA